MYDLSDFLYTDPYYLGAVGLGLLVASGIAGTLIAYLRGRPKTYLSSDYTTVIRRYRRRKGVT